jgi:hypothetical protein
MNRFTAERQYALVEWKASEGISASRPGRMRNSGDGAEVFGVVSPRRGSCTEGRAASGPAAVDVIWMVARPSDGKVGNGRT